jgi:hypothetical protein
LQDIPEDLATNFCQDYVRYQDSTTTCTVTGYPTTVTTTLAPTPCDYSTTPYPPVTSSTTANPTTAPPWSTVSSTTTITYTTCVCPLSMNCYFLTLSQYLHHLRPRHRSHLV